MLSQKKAFRRNARYYKGPLPNRRPNRPLRARVSVPHGAAGPQPALQFDATWAVINNALLEMHKHETSQLSFETMYRHAYQMVLKKHGDSLYTAIRKFEKDWLVNNTLATLLQVAKPLIEAAALGNMLTGLHNELRTQGQSFLQALTKAFEDHKLVVGMSTDVFMYLDRTWCSDNHVPSIYPSGMNEFRLCILGHRPLPAEPELRLENIATEVILSMIAMDRKGESVDKQLIKSAVAIFGGLYEDAYENEKDCLYHTIFEPRFLAASAFSYQHECLVLLNSNDAASYCRHTLDRLNEEISRCRTMLFPTTTPSITDVVERELIKNKLSDLIKTETGVKHMVENDRFSDLSLLYTLNARVDLKKKDLTEALQRGVQQSGETVNNAAIEASQAQNALDRALNIQTAAALQWVEENLKIKNKYDQIWKESLGSDPVIQPALTRSLSESVNSFQRSSEYISLFIDDYMKKGLRNKTEPEVEKVLDDAIVLLRYLSDKDMFERYYKKHLCKRLLMNKSLSTEHEREMIRKMKVELGNSFVSKLEAMFKDMALSQSLTSTYRDHISSTATTSKTLELSIHVLTSMTWPLESMHSSSMFEKDDSSRNKVIFPAEIEKVKKSFENFYGTKHNGRQLTWMPHMGTADIRATFPKIAGKEGTALGKERRYDLNVSTHAAMILLLFNDLEAGTTFTFNDIQSRTNINKSDLIRNLQSLSVAPKTRLLVKEPMSKDIKETDRFSYNESFISQFLRIKVGVVAGGDRNRVESDRERRETEKKNEDSRGYVIEAAVVRIMKQRKELSHQQLMAEVISLLSQQFHPDVALVKKKFESLMEREYIERIEGSDPASYRYLA